MRFKHITFRVKDIERSIAFYQTIAELSVVRRFRSEPAELAFLANGQGETEVEFVQIPGDQTFEGKGMFICFETDRLDEMHRLAGERGMNPSPIQDPGGQGRFFYVYDPDGVSVQLRSFPK